ncbi:MAG: hypothetical protein ABI707_17295 [Ferruginibacter sp.]
MKLLVFILLFVGCKSEEDNLSRYSYLLYGKDALAKDVVGTCFFVRNNNHIFIVTANHIACGCTREHKRDYLSPKKMEVLLNGCPQTLSIDIYKNWKTCDCNSPDYFIDTVSSIFSPYINSIEQFNLPIPDSTNIEKFTMFGYHPTDDIFSLDQPALKTEIKSKFSVLPVEDDSHNIIPSIHSVAFGNEVNIDMALEGDSGCPTFIKDKSDGKWKFIGLFVSKKVGANNRIYITKKKIVEDAIVNYGIDKGR